MSSFQRCVERIPTIVIPLKIIAVLKGDEVYEKWTDISDCPDSIVNRLKHYFLTYKGIPGEASPKVEITHIYGKEEALEVIGIVPPYTDTAFGAFTGNASLIRWFGFLNKHFKVHGEA